MAAKQSKSRKAKKKSSNKQKLSQLLSPKKTGTPSLPSIASNSNQSVPVCMRGDGFNIEQWLSSVSRESENKLSSQMLPTRAAAIKARNKNGLTNQGFGASTSQKERDQRECVSDNRVFYEEYAQPFKCIQLFNQAHLDVLTHKLHAVSNDHK